MVVSGSIIHMEYDINEGMEIHLSLGFEVETCLKPYFVVARLMLSPLQSLIGLMDTISG